MQFFVSGEVRGLFTSTCSSLLARNGIFGTMSSIVHIAVAGDTPSAGTSEALSRCRPTSPSGVRFRLHEPSHPTASKLRRSFSDSSQMQLNRDLGITHLSQGDTIAIAVCVSLGATGIVVIAIYVIMLYRRRQKILDAQDTLPRPFEITVPAATTAGASVMMQVPPPRIYAQCVSRGRNEVRRGKPHTNVGLQRAGTVQIPPPTALSHSQPGSSRDVRTQPHPSEMSLLSNRGGPSSYRSPPHSQSPTPDPHSQSGSRVQPGQYTSSLHTGIPQPQRTVSAPVNRSASVQERRSAKHALWLSRSASELYCATSSVQRYRVPEYGSQSASESRRYAHRYDRRARDVDKLSGPTNHLRQWHSASPVVHVHHVCGGPEEDVGGTITVIQHQDAGVMQELPPPYHKLVRSDGVEV